MKQKLKIIGRIILFAALIFGGPWVIMSQYTNWSRALLKYSITMPFQEGELLSYYGAILTAITTIYGLYLTFRDNRSGIREQSRLDKLPIIGVNSLNVSFNIPLFTTKKDLKVAVNSRSLKQESDNEYYFKEQKLENLYCVIEDGKTRVKRKLTKNELDIIKTQGLVNEEYAPGVTTVAPHEFIYAPFEVENIGNGPAIDLRFGFNRKEKIGTKYAKYVAPMPLKVGDVLYIVILADNSKSDNCGKYLLEFYYRDIFDNCYCQKMNLI